MNYTHNLIYFFTFWDALTLPHSMCVMCMTLCVQKHLHWPSLPAEFSIYNMNALNLPLDCALETTHTHTHTLVNRLFYSSDRKSIHSFMILVMSVWHQTSAATAWEQAEWARVHNRSEQQHRHSLTLNSKPRQSSN